MAKTRRRKRDHFHDLMETAWSSRLRLHAKSQLKRQDGLWIVTTPQGRDVPLGLYLRCYRLPYKTVWGLIANRGYGFAEACVKAERWAYEHCGQEPEFEVLFSDSRSFAGKFSASNPIAGRPREQP